jgi:hypothetical protein
MRTTTIIALLGAQALAGCSSGDAGAPAGDSGALAPPPPGDGVQYSMTTSLEPGQEIERCKLVVAPPEGLHIQRDEVQFTRGSHHVVLYKTDYAALPTETRNGVPIDPTVVHDCNDGATAEWEISGVIAGSQSFDGDTFLGPLPDGVALSVEPGAVLVMNTHYLNPSSDHLDVEARLNLYTIPPERVEVEASMLFYYNAFISVPANGTSSARMRCPVQRDISIVRLQSHMHRRGVGFEAFLVDGEGGPMEPIYDSAAWEQVPARSYDPPLEVKAGQAIDYRCDYANPEGRDVAQGLTTRDEMCMLIGPYFPRDRHLDDCSTPEGFPGETWVGTGAATCAETLACLAAAPPAEQDGGVRYYGCVVDSCPGAAVELTGVVSCQMTAGFGACEGACSAGGDGCGACMAEACADEVSACQAAACD